MKHQIRLGLLFSILLSLVSCASTMSMMVDIEKPAAVTLPVTVQNVILVDNAVPQPMGYGINAPSRRYSDIDSLYTKTLKTASWQVVMKAFDNLDYSKFFSNVSIYRKALRKDKEWLSVVPVNEEIKNDFFENENFDMLISIDRLLFHSTIEKDQPELGRMEISLTFSAYLRDEDEPIIHTITDTLKAYPLEASFYNGMPSLLPEEINTELIRQASSILGKKIGMAFAPGWETVSRTYFIRNLSDESRMNNFINKGKWVEAKNTWTSEFNKERKVVNQARLANNIAFASEMSGDFYGAEEWAVKAKTLFQNVSSKKYSGEILYLEEYIKALQERQSDNIILDKQHGNS